MKLAGRLFLSRLKVNNMKDLETKEMPELMYQKYIHKKEFIAYSIAYSKIDIAYNQLYEAIKGVFVVE